MNSKIKAIFTLLFTLFFTQSIIAADSAQKQQPDVFLEKVANAMIVAVEQNKAELKTNSTLAKGLVKTNLIPAIDTKTFSRLTLTSKIWKTLSEDQQKRFTASFIDLVIGNYASGLTLYDGQSFNFSKPIFSKSGKSSKVRSSMKQKTGTSIIIDYKLSNKSGSWKIIDLTIEGVNMVKSYKTQFLPKLKSLGIESFLADLEGSDK